MKRRQLAAERTAGPWMISAACAGSQESKNGQAFLVAAY